MSQQRAAFNKYFTGECLYGDDFTLEEIKSWYKDEAEAYANLGASDKHNYRYSYHALNKRHGYSKLPKRIFQHALGLGSAYGHEFEPIISSIKQITIVDPSDHFATNNLNGISVSYQKPDPSGTLDFPDAAFDLITCFGTLHHIPNVTYVLSEMGRVLNAGGYALIREPVVNMGDWRKARPGLTKHERGIPAKHMDQALRIAKFEIISRQPCVNPVVGRIAAKFSTSEPFNSEKIVLADELLANTLAWNMSYHRRNIFKKLSPSSIFWVARKIS